MINDVQQRKAAKDFAAYWNGKGYEKGESQKFWMSLLSDVFGVQNVAQFIEFEDQVHLDHTSFIDGYIPPTKVLIEQKGLGKDLNKPIKQSDGSLLTPFQQAKRYITELLDAAGVGNPDLSDYVLCRGWPGDDHNGGLPGQDLWLCHAGGRQHYYRRDGICAVRPWVLALSLPEGREAL